MTRKLQAYILILLLLLGLASPVFAVGEGTDSSLKQASLGGSNSGAGNTSTKKYIALTFDDGPGPYTDQILDILQQKKVSATFFVLGRRAELYPKVIKRINDDGHQIALHGYNHAGFTKMTTDQMRDEINKTTTAIEAATGTYINEYYFRPPGGNYTKAVLDTVNMPFILWTVDSLDWENRDAQTTYQNVVNHAFAGAIVLQHDIQPCNIQALPMIIDTLRSRGYEFVTVEQLFSKMGQNAVAGAVYGSIKSEPVYSDSDSIQLKNKSYINDVSSNSWYAGVCKTAIDKGLIDTDSNLFYPERAMTRGEAIEVLYRLAGSPSISDRGSDTVSKTDKAGSGDDQNSGSQISFYDVPESNTAVYWAAQQGIAGGYPDGSFRPDVKLSRQDFACFYYRYALSRCTEESLTQAIDVDLSQIDRFPDSSDTASYAVTSLCYMLESGLLAGDSDGRLMPASYLTRAQVCAIISRLL